MTQFNSYLNPIFEERTNCDLSRYFIVRKFSDGWLMGSQKGPETIFVTRAQLVRMGYLSEDPDLSPNKSWLSQPPTPRSQVITIPLTKEFRRRSLSRADEDKSWRAQSPPVEIPTKLSESKEIVVDGLLDLDEVPGLWSQMDVHSSSCPNREPTFLQESSSEEEFSNHSEDESRVQLSEPLKKSGDNLIFPMS